MANLNARASNLGQLFPFGATVAIISANRDARTSGLGQVIYTDALGVCVRRDSRTFFYPWANISAAEVVK